MEALYLFGFLIILAEQYKTEIQLYIAGVIIVVIVLLAVKRIYR